MKKALVAYFSATGATKRIGDMLAESIGAKTFEIVPKELYTNADLDWTNDNSRSSQEMKDRASRPEIESHVRDIKDYDVIFLGFPIWWYREPSIIDTFVEKHDFNGKLIVPFATSGGSPIADSYKGIATLAPKAKVERGKVFDSGVEPEELKKWADRYLRK
ncbi:MAG: NAD(P)H-dependent oxidoreductase [Alphaproteobacteria bacterium]|nr:NAD(P)H-dependent oxidoreductase [Alphaproteobacteria bacterium]